MVNLSVEMSPAEISEVKMNYGKGTCDYSDKKTLQNKQNKLSVLFSRGLAEIEIFHIVLMFLWNCEIVIKRQISRIHSKTIGSFCFILNEAFWIAFVVSDGLVDSD